MPISSVWFRSEICTGFNKVIKLCRCPHLRRFHIWISDEFRRVSVFLSATAVNENSIVDTDHFPRKLLQDNPSGKCGLFVGGQPVELLLICFDIDILSAIFELSQ